MIFQTEKTRELMSVEVDRYGDSFTRDTNVQLLKEVMNSMEVVGSFTLDNVCDCEKKFFAGEKPFFSMFSGQVFYFDLYGEDGTFLSCSPLRYPHQLVRFYQGAVSRKLVSKCTHVVMDPVNLKNYSKIEETLKAFPPLPSGEKRHVVSYEYVTKSAECGELLSEAEFSIKIFRRNKVREKKRQREEEKNSLPF